MNTNIIVGIIIKKNSNLTTNCFSREVVKNFAGGPKRSSVHQLCRGKVILGGVPESGQKKHNSSWVQFFQPWRENFEAFFFILWGVSPWNTPQKLKKTTVGQFLTPIFKKMFPSSPALPGCVNFHFHSPGGWEGCAAWLGSLPWKAFSFTLKVNLWSNVMLCTESNGFPFGVQTQKTVSNFKKSEQADIMGCIMCFHSPSLWACAVLAFHLHLQCAQRNAKCIVMFALWPKQTRNSSQQQKTPEICQKKHRELTLWIPFFIKLYYFLSMKKNAKHDSWKPKQKKNAGATDHQAWHGGFNHTIAHWEEKTIREGMEAQKNCWLDGNWSPPLH